MVTDALLALMTKKTKTKIGINTQNRCYINTKIDLNLLICFEHSAILCSKHIFSNHFCYIINVASRYHIVHFLEIHALYHILIGVVSEKSTDGRSAFITLYFSSGDASYLKEENMEKKKNYEELTIRDHFMFGKICTDPENRKLLIDALLQTDLKEKHGSIEKHIQEYRNSKYARLDLLSEDENGKIYNAEMQNKSKNPVRQLELPKRSRYYQALLDTAYLGSGEDYMNLAETVIIFICTFDPFGKGEALYTFETKCVEDDNLKFDDQIQKLFFNTTADLSSLPQSTQNMLSYINTGNAVDEATEKIDVAVKNARTKEEWRREYMLTVVHDIDVKREGREEGRISTLCHLANKGIITIEVAAEQAGMTIPEFEKEMAKN